MVSKRIGIIGVGNMGEALVSGMIRSNIADSSNLVACDVREQRREHIKKTYSIHCYSENQLLVGESDVVILAVKPKDIKLVLEQIRDKLTKKQLLISIAAGIGTTFISNILLKNIQIVRVMPNNPCMVGEGMSVLSPIANVSEENLSTAMEIFSAIGRVVVIDEKHMDAATGLSGSGPAYIYYVIEALTDGGIKEGLSKDVAVLLAAQTCLGSAKMILETKKTPTELINMVATPEGTTVRGLAELKKGNVGEYFSMAVEKAAQRSKELSIE